MRKIRVVLHGAIAKVVDGPIELFASTVRQALSGLKMFPELNPLNTPDRYLCTVEGVSLVSDLDKPLDVDELHVYCEAKTNAREIRGSGNNPYVRIIIGVVLIVVGVLITPWAPNAGMMFISAGISLIFGGIAQILNPPPKPEEPSKTSSLTGYENTVKSGTPIPIIVGEHLHGGHIISFNVETLAGKDLDLKDFFFNPQALQNTSWTILVDGSNDEPTNTVPPGRGRPGGGGNQNQQN